jgi:hypothetical protein
MLIFQIGLVLKYKHQFDENLKFLILSLILYEVMVVLNQYVWWLNFYL